jgi:hypothetical protein
MLPGIPSKGHQEVANNFLKEGTFPVQGAEATHSLMAGIAGIPEEGSMISQQSLTNQLSGHLGAPMSELSVSEVYESYQFMQNSLISFYPKDVRRCI